MEEKNNTTKVVIAVLAGFIAVVALIFLVVLCVSNSQQENAVEQMATQSENASIKKDVSDVSSNASSGSSSTNSNSSNNNNSNNNQSTSNQNSSGHVHEWEEKEEVKHVAEVSHTETVTTPGEDIVEYHTVCNACGTICDGENALSAHYQVVPEHIKAGYTVNVPFVVGQSAGSSTQVKVVDTPAHDEIIRKKVCKTCGQTE